jgi:hypothetical protein
MFAFETVVVAIACAAAAGGALARQREPAAFGYLRTGQLSAQLGHSWKNIGGPQWQNAAMANRTDKARSAQAQAKSRMRT